MTPERDTFEHRNQENLEAIVFTMAQTGEVRRVDKGKPTPTIDKLPDPSESQEMDVTTVTADGFVRIFYGGEWIFFYEYLAMIGAAPTDAIALPTPQVYIKTGDNGYNDGATWYRLPQSDTMYIYSKDNVASPIIDTGTLEVWAFKYSRKRNYTLSLGGGFTERETRYSRFVHPTHQDGSKHTGEDKRTGIPGRLRDTEWAFSGVNHDYLNLGNSTSRETRFKKINKTSNPLSWYVYGPAGAKNTKAHAAYFRFAFTYVKNGKRFFGPMSEKIGLMPDYNNGLIKKLRLIYADR